MYKIAVMGDRDSVLGFKALGLQVFFADTADKAKPLLHQLAKDDYAVIYLTEQLASCLQSEIECYQDNITPAIILIPGKGGSLGIGMEQVHKAVERAVGTDILNNG